MTNKMVMEIEDRHFHVSTNDVSLWVIIISKDHNQQVTHLQDSTLCLLPWFRLIFSHWFDNIVLIDDNIEAIQNCSNVSNMWF